jgi:hypothetical protein
MFVFEVTVTEPGWEPTVSRAIDRRPACEINLWAG